MNPQLKQLLRVAVMGAAGGFVFMFVMILFGLDTPSSSGEKGVIRICCDWLSSPLGWLVEWARGKHLLTKDSVSMMLIAIFTYWILLGAIIAVFGYYLRQLIPRREGSRQGVTSPQITNELAQDEEKPFDK